MSEETLIRPSSLPKLAACRCFRNLPGTSEAAERGTRMDAAIRAAWAAGTYVDPAAVANNDDEMEACNWALDKLKELAGDMELETREEELAAVSPVQGIKDGTMDGLCVAGQFLVDYKSGQVRNYLEQMAQYSLCCMDMYFADAWTAYLLFIDQQVVVTHRFTREEAEDLVVAVRDKEKEPCACDYCSWCAGFQEGCPVVSTAVAEVSAAAESLPVLKPVHKDNPATWPESIRALAENQEKAAEFLRLLKVAADWGDELKKQLKKNPNLDSKHFKLVSVAGSRKVYPLMLGKHIREWGTDNILKLCDTIPYKKFEEEWKRHEGDKPIPEDYYGNFGGSVQLRLTPNKKTTKEQ